MAFDIAGDLDRGISAYSHVPGLVEHIKRAVGADPGGEILGQVGIRAFILRPEENVFAAYILTQDAFVVAEMSREGSTLAVWMDLSRISRVAEIVHEGRRTLTVEIDGDMRRTDFEAETASQTENGASQGRGILRGRTIPASYEIAAPAEEGELAWFALQIRRINR